MRNTKLHREVAALGIKVVNQKHHGTAYHTTVRVHVYTQPITYPLVPDASALPPDQQLPEFQAEQ